MSNTAPLNSLFNVPKELPPTPRETSRAALERITPELPEKRATVWAFIRARVDGLTDNEGIELSGMKNGWRARRIELERDKLVLNSGRTRGGSIVWIAVNPEPRST